MNDAFLTILQALIAITVWEGYKWARDLIVNPYRFTCRDCGLITKTSDKKTLDVVQITHSHNRPAADKKEN